MTLVYINTLRGRSGCISSQAPTPTGLFLPFFAYAPLASDLPIDDVLKKHKASYLDLFTIISSFWRKKKETKPLDPQMAESSLHHLCLYYYLYTKFGGSVVASLPKHTRASFHVSYEKHYTLRVDFEKEKRYALYSQFEVVSERFKCKLTLGMYDGTAGICKHKLFSFQLRHCI